MKRLIRVGLVLGVTLLSACVRIETGEVGLRVGIDKQISGTELLPGSFNQTMLSFKLLCQSLSSG